MLTKFALQNFKSIGEPGVELELKPLTILLGPNSSGKSSILEGLALFAQSAVLNRKGSTGLSFGEDYLVNFSSFKDIVHKCNPLEKVKVEVHIGLKKKEKGDLKGKFPEITKEPNTVGYQYLARFLPTGKEIKQTILSNGETMISMGGGGEKVRGSSFTYPAELKNEQAGFNFEKILSPNGFSPFKPLGEEKAKALVESAKDVTELIASRFINSKKESKILFISGLRGEIREQAEEANWIGKHGENLAHILSMCLAPLYRESKGKKVKKWATEFNIKDLWAGPEKESWSVGEEKRMKSLFTDFELDTPLSLALASYGSRQILTVITQLFWSEPGDIIMIEEPEISLHPESQAKLPELFADAISEGKQIIVTTHSDFFPYALRKAIESEEHHLNVRDIAVYEIKRDEKGCTKAEQRRLDETGYIEGWIPSFRKVDEELSERWFKTLEGEEE